MKNPAEFKIVKNIKKVMKIITMMPIIYKFVILLVTIMTVLVIVHKVIEKLKSNNTAKLTYEQLGVDNLSELVEIKGNDQDGYYLEFSEDFDEKIDQFIESTHNRSVTYNFKGTGRRELLVNMIKAEIVSQFPNLGGKITDASTQFQGIVKMRRISPNKELVTIDESIGIGEITTIEDLGEDNFLNEDGIDNTSGKFNHKIGEVLQAKTSAKLYVKGTYNFSGDKTSDEGVTSKEMTLMFKIEGALELRSVSRGQVVYFLGDVIYDGKNTYVEVSLEENGQSLGYIKKSEVRLALIDDTGEVENIGETTVVEQNDIYSEISSRVYDLKYVSPEKFEEYISNNSKEALEVYTLDSETYNIRTAVWSSDNNGITIRENANMSFRETIKKYVIPYEYLLILLIDTKNEAFIKELAEEVVKGEIVVAVQDSVTTSESNREVYERVEVSGHQEAIDIFSRDRTKSETKSSYSLNEYSTTSINITYADVWFSTYRRETTYNSESLNIGKDQELDGIYAVKGKFKVTKENYDSGEIAVTDRLQSSYFEEDNQGRPVSTITYIYQRFEHTITNTTNVSVKYEDGELLKDTRLESKFVKLFKKHNAKAGFTETRLFSILGSNEKTSGLVDLTRSLIYEAINKDFGVTEFDYNGFVKSAFTNTTGIYGNTVQEKVWFALKDAGFNEIAIAAAMGNIHYESGSFNPYSIEGGYTEFDGGIGLCQWTNNARGPNGRNSQLRAFAQTRGTIWQDENIQVEFLVAELTGGGADGHAANAWAGMDNQRVIWESGNDIAEATRAFCVGFERPGAEYVHTSMPKRLEWAEKYYNEFKGQEKPASGVGNVTLSGTNKEKMEQLLAEAIRIANDDRYYYTQDQGELGRMSEFGYDCSSFVSRLYMQYFGKVVPGTTHFYTSEYFVGAEGSVELQPGDVLWRAEHVEIYIGNGQKVGAVADVIDSKAVPRPDQIRVNDYVPGYYTRIYRFITD